MPSTPTVVPSAINSFYSIKELSTRYIAQVNSIAASKEVANPYLSHRLFHSSPKPPVNDQHFSFQSNILRQDEYVISLLSQKVSGVAFSTEKLITATPAPSLSPAVNMAAVLNAAAHARNAETEKAAMKEIVPLLEKRPSDVGLILTIAHLYVITNNYAAATHMLETFFKRLEHVGRIELPRDKTVDPGTKHEVVETAVVRPTAVKGADTGPQKINVNIGSNAEQTDKQRAAEKARQDKIAMQNQLPSWHTQSTVAKDAAGNAASTKQESNGTDSPGIKTEAGEAKSGNLDAVFAQIEAERRRKEEEEEEEDDEDDDDDEFEDVTGTPGAPPDPKRVKLESSAAPTPSNAATPAASNGDGGDESEEDEFEDVN